MKAQFNLWLWQIGSYEVWGCLVVVFAALLCLCVCNERYSHRATGSVRKGLKILPHSFLLTSKLRYASRDRPAFGQITLHTYSSRSRVLPIQTADRTFGDQKTINFLDGKWTRIIFSLYHSWWLKSRPDLCESVRSVALRTHRKFGGTDAVHWDKRRNGKVSCFKIDRLVSLTLLCE